MSSIGKRIKARRLELKLSGADLARAIGIAAPSLWQIENGVTKSLKAETLSALVVKLHTTAGFLLDGDLSHVGLELASMEAELIYSIRALPAAKRLALMEYARFLRGQQPAQPVADTAEKLPSVIRQLKPKKHK